MTDKKQKRPTHNWAKDQDYWEKLSKEDRAWLSQFNSEFYHGSFPTGRPSIHPEYFKTDCRMRKRAMWLDAMTGAAALNPEAIHLPPLSPEDV